MTSPEPWWITWPVEEVAATILPLCSGELRDEDEFVRAVRHWMLTGEFTPQPVKLFSTSTITTIERGFGNPEIRAIAEAMQVLEHARLLIRVLAVTDNSYRRIALTRRGMQALQTNTVRQHLGLCETPPA
jgi:hypothetical protein